MSDPTKPNDVSSRRAPAARGHIAGIIALVALFVVVAAWFWTSRQPARVETGIELPHGVMLASTGVFLAALLAEIRAMSFWELVEAAWELLLGLLAAIGAILKGVCNGILSLLGWD